jgi:hypothetical protein
MRPLRGTGSVKPLFPEVPWSKAGIPAGSIEGLLYNGPSETLVTITCRRLPQGPSAYRLYFRRLPELIYHPVVPRDEWENQNNALCCEQAPFLFFNEFRFRPLPKAEPLPAYLQQLVKDQAEPPAYGADWIGIRCFNLQTGEDRRVLDQETINPPSPYTIAWVSSLMSVNADGSGGVCRVSLSTGGIAKCFVHELSFTEGLGRRIAELPHVFV